jgi:hypothetical protein
VIVNVLRSGVKHGWHCPILIVEHFSCAFPNDIKEYSMFLLSVVASWQYAGLRKLVL